MVFHKNADLCTKEQADVIRRTIDKLHQLGEGIGSVYVTDVVCDEGIMNVSEVVLRIRTIMSEQDKQEAPVVSTDTPKQDAKPRTLSEFFSGR